MDARKPCAVRLAHRPNGMMLMQDYYPDVVMLTEGDTPDRIYLSASPAGTDQSTNVLYDPQKDDMHGQDRQ